MTRAWIAIAVFACVALALTHATPAAQDATCNAAYNQGLAFVREGDYQQALKDFERVVSSCGQPGLKAMAHYQEGLIFLKQWPRDFTKARRAADVIARDYPNTAAGPYGLILGGLVELADGRSFRNAIAEFKRVNRERTKSVEALAEAQYRIGEAQRLDHQPDAALETFRAIPSRYPSTVWAARALITSASCLVQLGQFIPAMEALQRVRRDYREFDEADIALKRNTILYRLAMRSASREAEQVMVGKSRFTDGVALAMGPGGRVLVAHRDGLGILKGDTGDLLPPDARPAASSFDVTGVGMVAGAVALARNKVVVFDREGVNPFQPWVAQNDGNKQEVEISSLAGNWRGDLLIADAKTNTIRKYLATTGAHEKILVQNVRANRLAQNDLDDLAVLDDQKTVLVFDREGTRLGDIQRRGPVGSNRAPEYEIETPIDVAYDILGNIYVLDGGRNVIYVFDPRRQFRTRIQLPVKGLAGVKKAHAMTIDEAGRIFVLDREAKQVLGYQ